MPAAWRTGSGRVARAERLQDVGAEDAVAWSPSPFLEREHRDGGLVSRPSRHPGLGHEPEIGQELLRLPEGRRALARERLAHRAAEVVAGKQADGNAALDPDAHADHTGHRPECPDELSDARGEQRLVTSGGEARAEVDRHHPSRDRQIADVGAGRNRTADPFCALCTSRPREERTQQARHGRSGPRDRHGLAVAQEPDLSAPRLGPAERRSGDRERAGSDSSGNRQPDAPHGAQFTLSAPTPAPSVGEPHGSPTCPLLCRRARVTRLWASRQSRLRPSWFPHGQRLTNQIGVRLQSSDTCSSRGVSATARAGPGRRRPGTAPRPRPLPTSSRAARRRDCRARDSRRRGGRRRRRRR